MFPCFNSISIQHRRPSLKLSFNAHSFHIHRMFIKVSCIRMFIWYAVSMSTLNLNNVKSMNTLWFNTSDKLLQSITLYRINFFKSTQHTIINDFLFILLRIIILSKRITLFFLKDFFASINLLVTFSVCFQITRLFLQMILFILLCIYCQRINCWIIIFVHYIIVSTKHVIARGAMRYSQLCDLCTFCRCSV